MTDQWFQVDRRGLANTIEQPERLPLELYQNAVDEPITQVHIELRPGSKRARAELVVFDDSPDGFHDLTESYTLYAASKKREDATKRGRMNVGEKRLLSLCDEATIVSTKGGVEFAADGTRKTLRRKREFGTEFRGVLRLRKAELEAAIELLRSVIPPEGVTVTVNGIEVPHRTPVHTFTAKLATVLPDEDGVLSRKTRRQCEVRLYEPLEGEVPAIMELGIPVVDGGTSWITDVQQRVPLNTERDNVPVAWLAELRTLVLNEMHDRITEEDANTPWAQEAIRHEQVGPQAVKAVIVHRFGERAVAYDPSDHEANKIAVSQGYTVVNGRSLPAETWKVVKEHGLMQAAGKVTPSATALFNQRHSGDGPDTSVPREKWTPGMVRMAAYASAMAEQLIGRRIEVGFDNDITEPVAAYYSRIGGLTFNVGRLGHRWFDQPDQEKVDELIIHELGHEYEADHLDHGYHDALCQLGARMRTVTVSIEQFDAAPATTG